MNHDFMISLRCIFDSWLKFYPIEIFFFSLFILSHILIGFYRVFYSEYILALLGNFSYFVKGCLKILFSDKYFTSFFFLFFKENIVYQLKDDLCVIQNHFFSAAFLKTKISLCENSSTPGLSVKCIIQLTLSRLAMFVLYRFQGLAKDKEAD